MQRVFKALKGINQTHSHITFEDCVFENFKYEKCLFQNCTFINCTFTNFHMDDCNLPGTIFTSCTFQQSSFSKVNQLNICKSSIDDTKITDIGCITLINSTIVRSSIKDAFLTLDSKTTVDRLVTTDVILNNAYNT